MSRVTDYTDAFSQGNEDPLSSSGQWNSGYTSGNQQVVGNRVRPSTIANYGVSTLVGLTTLDVWVQLTVAAWNNSSAGVIAAAAIFRAASPPTYTFYEVDIVKNPGVSARLEFYANVAGTFTLIDHLTSLVVAAGDVFRVELRSWTIAVYQNDLQIWTATDGSTTLATGLTGFATYTAASGSLGDVEADDVSIGHFGNRFFLVP